jgi:Lsr2
VNTDERRYRTPEAARRAVTDTLKTEAAASLWHLSDVRPGAGHRRLRAGGPQVPTTRGTRDRPVGGALDRADRLGFLHPGGGPDLGSTDDAALAAEEEVTRRIATLRDRWAAGQVGDEDFFPLIEKLRARLAQIDNDRKLHEPMIVYGQTVTAMAVRVAWPQVLAMVGYLEGASSGASRPSGRCWPSTSTGSPSARCPSGAATPSTTPPCPSAGEPRSAVSGQAPRPGWSARASKSNSADEAPPTNLRPSGMLDPEQHSGGGGTGAALATRRVVTRVDDLDGSPDAHPLRFGLDGQAYEIDLTDVHAQQFREVPAPYVSAGRRLTRSGRPYVRVDLETSTTGAGRRGRRRRRLTSWLAQT